MADAAKQVPKTSPEQLLLNWPINETFAEEEFLPSFSNKEAVKWVDEWPRWERGGQTFHCLIIYGPEGCGKTHLSHVWGCLSGAKVLSANELKNTDFLVGDEFVFIVEDVDVAIKEQEIEESLLHLYNWLKEQGGYLLLTSKNRPKKWQIELADLSSRLLASENVKIMPPDDTLLTAVIKKQFSDRQIVLADKVISYLIKHADRSFSFVRSMVREIDQLSLSEKKKITIPIVKRVLRKLDKG